MECVIEVDGVPRQYIARLRGTETAPQGTPRGCILSLTDITLQKRQQESLEAKNEQLERLASVVSHDLATPLATGENLLHLIKSDLDSSHSEMQQSLSDLETVHHRLRAFAEGLPALARESTDVETPIDCDLETVAWEAWEVVDTAGNRPQSAAPTAARKPPAAALQSSLERPASTKTSHSQRPQSPSKALAASARAPPACSRSGVQPSSPSQTLTARSTNRGNRGCPAGVRCRR